MDYRYLATPNLTFAAHPTKKLKDTYEHELEQPIGSTVSINKLAP